MSQAVEKILNLYVKYGSSDYIGENITQIEHALQCAECAEKDLRLMHYDNYVHDCVIVAALLHDIGHLIGIENKEMEMKHLDQNLGIVGHEGVGSEYLRECGLPDLVCELVKYHVKAKRYLCSTRYEYYEKLSDASKNTMELQGGLMTEEEMLEFNSSKHPDLKIYLREYDDLGKCNTTTNSTIGLGIEKYKEKIEKLIRHV